MIEELDRPGRYRFTHALMQETLLAELSTTRRVRLHGQVGDALERRWADTAERHAPELAAHFDDASTISAAHAQRAVRYHRLAAEQAEAVSAWDDARQHYQRCVDLLDTTEADLDVDHAELLASYARSAYNSGDVRAAWRAFQVAIDEYRQAGDAAALARVTLDALRVYPRADQVDRLVHDALDALGDTDAHLEALLLLELANTALQRRPAQRHRTRTPRRALCRPRLGRRHRRPTRRRDHPRDDRVGHRRVRISPSLPRRVRALRPPRPTRDEPSKRSSPGQGAASQSLDARLAAADETVAYARTYGIGYIDEIVLMLVGWVHVARGDWAALDRARAELPAVSSQGVGETSTPSDTGGPDASTTPSHALPDPNRDHHSQPPWQAPWVSGARSCRRPGAPAKPPTPSPRSER